MRISQYLTSSIVPFFQNPVCKMGLAVRPVELTDVAECARMRVAALGSLVIGRPPPYAGYVEEQAASFKSAIESQPHVRLMKVVDPENEDEILSFAKWEVYKHGRPDLHKLRQPMNAHDKEVDGFGALREAAHEYFSSRNGGEMGETPHLLLALLVTTDKHRRRGAGSLLVQWGIDLSESLGVQCYVQASEQGRRLYQHHGFQDVDSVRFDLSQYGLEGIEIMTEMIRIPQKHLERG
ncbi:hypothetical protein F4825DRAFT_91631 [Nemania diffusa]|nr:hypothetical protein F4825DRAFT_91631 [Nemania diffusa]